MRHKLIVFSLILLALAACAAIGRGSGTVLAAGIDQTPRGQAFEYPGADNVSVVSQQCLPDGSVLININWQTYNLGYQWTDLSLYNNGWIWGTFVGIGPALPSATSQPWGGLLPGYWHYLRINTLTPFGWWPSSTISFFTRNDCFQAPFDSDGDGVPNSQDLCPNQFGSPAYGGCPVPQPGGGQFGNMCAAGWCPGQPAPAQFCPSQPQILIFPPPAAGCVWVTKGENSTYAIGEQVTVCWWLNRAMDIRIDTQRPTDTSPVLPLVSDDGRGGCTNTNYAGQPLITGLPTGQRITRLYGPSNQVLDTMIWYVQ